MDETQLRTTASWLSGQDPHACLVEIGHATALVVQARAGSPDVAISPHGLLDAALAASTAMRAARFLRRARVPVQSIRVEVAHAPLPFKLMFTLAIDIVGSLSELQREALLRVANGCAIHKALMCDISIVTLESLRREP